MSFGKALIAAGALSVGVFASGPASAAMKAGEYLNGQWGSSDGGGRGITLTYVPDDSGDGTLFGLVFGYRNSDGQNVWLRVQAPILEHQFQATGSIDLIEGGNFGFPPTSPAAQTIGNFTVTLNSCSNITYAFDFNEGTGFEDVTWNLDPLVLRNSGEFEQCVYTSEFTGCPDFATPVAGLERACVLNGVYRNQDLVLTNDTTWVLNGLVQIGDDNANSSTITIEPGTLLVGAGGTADYLYINPGSKIYAEGLPHAPIVLTTPNDGFIPGTQPQPGEVGGLVVSGNAPCNSSPDDNLCFSEFDPTLRYGGDDPHDSSGVIRYWQIRYGGYEFQPNREVNAFTFQAVGDGTVVSHLQSYANLDDAIEFFGGTVNARYIVGTAGNDDGIDWDEGWSGKLQYALIIYTDASNGDHGIEAANNPDNDDALPRAKPVLSNLTLIGAAGTGDGIRFKEGTAGQVWNSVVTGFEANCIRFVDLATYTAAGSVASPTGDTAFAGNLIGGCANLFRDEDGAPFAVADFYAAFPGNQVASDLMLQGYQPMPGSPALGGAVQVFDLATGDADDFFDNTRYRGAFDGMTDWTRGWTHDVTGENAF
ncbi:MAG: hypothetical protein Kow0020_05920 [Wenzhouxiangellaceae bacterium]